MSIEFGVQSEVGKLRKVIVHRPELSLKRLTPTNHDELLFDDVLWVERAQWEHDQFAEAMRDRGVEVYYHVELLGEALAASEEGRKSVIEIVASEYTVGWSLVDEVREFLAKMKPDLLAKHLVGGLTIGEMENGGFDLAKFRSISLGAAAVDDTGFFVLPPVPNSLFQRDPSCWIYNGVTVNPMFWPARRRESLNMLTIYRYHPMFQAAKFNFWYPEQTDDKGFNIQDFGRASMEGGDVQPIGYGTVAIGCSERTQARMIELVAKKLFESGGAERVLVAMMTKDRAHMHLDTVFTLLDRDIATAFPKVVNNIRGISLRPGKKPGDFHVTEEKSFLDAVADALHVKKLNIVETGGDEYQAQRRQDDANNTVALEPGVVVSCGRNTYTISKMRQAGGSGRHCRIRVG
jgi:arginine deiminase